MDFVWTEFDGAREAENTISARYLLN